MEATAEAETKLIEIRAVEASGLGFDLTFNFRLKFAKGIGRERFVVLDEANKKVVVIPGGVSVHGIFSAIRASKCGLSPIFGNSIRFIQNYGTHIIVGMAIGVQDLVCVRQQPSSMIRPAGKFGGSL